MKLIVGLGNPGSSYDTTRHNVGFMALERLREHLEFKNFRHESKFKAELSRGEWDGQKLILVRPQTFMNLSGEAVQSVRQFYKISPEDIWVAYDDIDLPLGALRIRESGSAGTHNGMKSIIQSISSDQFPRFRLGIESRGELTPAQQNLSSFVLEPFRNEELSAVHEMLDRFVQASKLALREGVVGARSEFSS